MPARNCSKVMPSIVLSARMRLLLRSASGIGAQSIGDLGSGQIRNALAQQYFNGAQLSHGEAYFTEGALVKPIDKLAGSTPRSRLRAPRQITVGSAVASSGSARTTGGTSTT
jgi:hypothetical protein